jgi:hypothetical protein
MEENDAIKPPAEEPTPEVARLLKILEMQRAAHRERGLRTPSAMQTPAFRYGMLIVIAVFAFGSLGVLEWVLSQIARPGHTGTAATPQESTLGTPAKGQ